MEVRSFQSQPIFVVKSNFVTVGAFVEAQQIAALSIVLSRPLQPADDAALAVGQLHARGRHVQQLPTIEQDLV